MDVVRKQLWRGKVAWLCAILLLATWAAAPFHGHSDSARDACTVCQFEHSPADAAVEGPVVVPPTRTVVAVTPAAAASPEVLEPSTGQSRAPPSFA